MTKYITLVLVALLALSAQAVTPSFYGVEEALLNAGGSVAIGDSGEIVIKRFTYTSTAMTNATVALVRIPAHSRIIGGTLKVEDMGGTETHDLGLIGANGNGYINDTDSTADDVDLFIDNGASPADSGWDTGGVAGGIGEADATYAAYDKDVYLTLTAPSGGDIWVADKAISGWVMYIKP